MMDLKQAMEWADRWRIQGQETEDEEKEFPDETVMGILVDEVRRLQALQVPTPEYVESEATKLLREVVEDRTEANYSLGTDLVDRIDALLSRISGESK